jgi:type IV secretory pathway component VirB8
LILQRTRRGIHSLEAINPMTTTAMDGASTYLESTELRDWYADKYAMATVRASRCFVLALVLGLIAAAAIAAIAAMLPLKSIKPLIVTVDSRSGLVVSVQPVENVTSLTEHDVIAQSNLYRYVIARLTYLPCPGSTCCETHYAHSAQTR